MSRQLVLVHGRSQQHKDPANLKKEWLASLGEGLAKSGLVLPIPETDVHFPYYGDALIDLVDGTPVDEAAEIVIKGGGDSEMDIFVQQVIEEVRREIGISEADLAAIGGAEIVEKGPLNWGWVQAVLRAIDTRSPRGSALTLYLATRDVYEYLIDKITKDDIDEGVAAAIQPGAETVVVSHSLGTVVAQSVLSERGRALGLKVPQFVTLGSPLAVSRIRSSITPPRWPSCVENWFNARDSRDVVALYPLDAEHFPVGDDTPGIVQKSDVRNETPNRHGISGYLSDPDVAWVIHQSLVG